MPWVTAAATMLSMLDKESTIPDIKPGKIWYTEEPLKQVEACGWKCTGCKATNGPETNKCIWCRSYRIACPQDQDAQTTHTGMLMAQPQLNAIQSSANPMLGVYSAPPCVNIQNALQFFTHSTEDK